ncbi:DUF4873 domain-containing protein [Pseudonocardia oroxyli]|uniref:DUF4873 domain-containing protein n=1 Tax=Pseudonocardia oroxyli TaxID=366584 RepID=A0A1G7QPC2_PSEOR|nr:DUF4873 domain-containing protein [Pseudonocardia oroxyli]SDG00365.1 protein of unknown function [Pseudonocardia oroxyli]
MSDEVDYAGPATLTIDGTALDVHVRLEAHTQPQDGKVHWYGRVTRDPASGAALAGVLGGRNADVVVSTATGSARGRIGDVDLWGRYRLSGVGSPPYPLDEPPTE